MDDEEIADEMAIALENAAVWLRGYESSHRAKGTHDGNIEADTYLRRAQALEELVARYRGD